MVFSNSKCMIKTSSFLANTQNPNQAYQEAG